MSGALLLLLASAALPTDEIKTVFGKNMQTTLCGPAGGTGGDAVRREALLGQLALAYGINVLDLPPVPATAGVGQPGTAAGNFAAWIVARRRVAEPTAAGLGLDPSRDKLLDSLDQLSTDLADYLRWLALHPTGQSYRLAAGFAPSAGDDDAQTATLLADFLHDVLAPGTPSTPQLFCNRATPTPATVATAAPVGDRAAPTLQLAVRGKIDDLATPGRAVGQGDAAGYKAASSATAAFTDDHVKGQSTIAIDATIGVGLARNRADALLAFVHYSQSTSETRAAGDDDDSADIRALSPGLFVRHLTEIGRDGGILDAMFGLVAYPTFDFARHSRTGRVRMMLDDIALNLLGGPSVCGREAGFGGRDGTFDLIVNCRAQVFAEGAHVWRAGTSADLAALEHDDYVGLGGDLQLAVSLPSEPALRPFTLSAEYRYMAVVSGRLRDPHRLSLALAYMLPKSDLSIGVAYDRGANFDTFQTERVTKLTVGYKY